MIDLVICEKQQLVSLADAIRSRAGSSSSMTIDDMVATILSSPSFEGLVLVTADDYNLIESNDAQLTAEEE